MRRILEIAAIALLATATVPTPPPAPAHAQAQADGCTSPLGDRPLRLVSFHDACDAHDGCYRHHSKGDGAAGRLACDRAFLRDMRRACRSAPGLTDRQRRGCAVIAMVYYGGVRLLGWPFFVVTPPAARSAGSGG